MFVWSKQSQARGSESLGTRLRSHKITQYPQNPLTKPQPSRTGYYLSALLPFMSIAGKVLVSCQQRMSRQYQSRVEKNTRARSARSDDNASTGSTWCEGRGDDGEEERGRVE